MSASSVVLLKRTEVARHMNGTLTSMNILSRKTMRQVRTPDSKESWVRAGRFAQYWIKSGLSLLPIQLYLSKAKRASRRETDEVSRQDSKKRPLT